jgi:ligand-binding sensor domain-containing protein/two-component sensor histidine kinase
VNQSARSTLRTLPLFLLIALVHIAQAEQLPIKTYTTADGLAHTSIHHIHQDKKGYLWIATREGLSRFDGYGFTNYGARDGLGHPFINTVVEDLHGRIWVGTNGAGIACLIDQPHLRESQTSLNGQTSKPKFRNFAVGPSPETNRVNAIAIDAEDRIWCATDGGLYRAADVAGLNLTFEAVAPRPPLAIGMSALVDSHGRLWFGMRNEVIEVVHERVIVYNAADEVGQFTISDMVEDLDGRILVANSSDVFEFIAPDDFAGRGRWQRVWASSQIPRLARLATSVGASIFHAMAGTFELGIHSLAADSTGALWIGTERGLIKYKDGRQSFYTQAEGLGHNIVMSLFVDRDRNLWIGTGGGGISKLSGELMVSFKEADGLPDRDVTRIIEGADGRIYAITSNGAAAEIGEGRAKPIQGLGTYPFNNDHVFCDRRGDWWVGSDRGLYWFSGPELQVNRGKKYTLADGLPEALTYSIHEDREGRILVSMTDNYFYRLDPRTRTFNRLSLGANSPFDSIPSVLSDSTGALWLGKWGVLGRWTGGRLTLLEPSAGLPETDPRSLFLDSRGWLWIGLRYQGVSVTKDPAAASPTFTNYASDDGLASGTVWSIAEDEQGRIYLGTGRGLDRLDTATGTIRHFTTAVGLAGNEVHHCLKDRQGNIWIATTGGVSKLNPRVEQVINRPPPIYLTRIQIAGEDLPIAETGNALVPGLELPASRNNLLIDYVGLDFHGEHGLKYQYRLEGADSDWSAPTEQKSVNYARLAPGMYRFLVRAIDQEGIASEQPAVLEFRILSPLLQRWWFITLTAIFVGLIIYATYRYRVAQLIKLERVRTGIASDLHDDIGSNLSVIAGLSDGLLRADRATPVTNEQLSLIAAISQRSLEAMSDIVWAVNPKKDHLHDLTRRMRLFADEAFFGHDIELQFSADAASDARIGAETRRAVFLIFKEAVNNIVRHSGCSMANTRLKLDHKTLVLEVSDDGKGFDPEQARAGEGLASMKRRAAKIDAGLEVISNSGHGTTVRLRAPLG